MAKNHGRDEKAIYATATVLQLILTLWKSPIIHATSNTSDFFPVLGKVLLIKTSICWASKTISGPLMLNGMERLYTCTGHSRGVQRACEKIQCWHLVGVHILYAWYSIFHFIWTLEWQRLMHSLTCYFLLALLEKSYCDSRLTLDIHPCAFH